MKVHPTSDVGPRLRGVTADDEAVARGSFADRVYFRAVRIGILSGILAGAIVVALVLGVAIAVNGTFHVGYLFSAMYGGLAAGFFLGGFTALNLTGPAKVARATSDERAKRRAA